MEIIQNLDGKETGLIIPPRQFLNIFAAAFICTLLFCGRFALNVQAQTTQPDEVAPAETQEPALLTAEAIQERIDYLKQVQGLEESIRTQAISTYEQALIYRKSATDWKTKAEEHLQAIQSAPENITKVKEELAALEYQQVTEIPSDLSTEQLEQLLSKEKESLETFRTAASDLDAEIKRRTDRRTEIPKMQAAAQQKLDEMGAITSPPGGNELDLAHLAQQITLAAAYRKEIQCYKTELDRYDAARELLTLRRDLAQRKANLSQRHLDHIQTTLSQQLKKEAESTARQASELASSIPPALQKLAQENAELAAERTGENSPSAKILLITSKSNETKELLDRIRQSYKSIQEKEKAVGLTQAVGTLMRKQLMDLPDRNKYQQRSDARAEEISSTHLKIIELEEQRRPLADLDTYRQKIFDGLDPRQIKDKEQINQSIMELLRNKRSYLDALIKDYNTYFSKLIDLDSQEKSLVIETTVLSDYINQHILWVRSLSVIDDSDFKNAVREMLLLGDPKNLAQFTKAIKRDFSSHRMDWASIAILLLLLVMARIRCLRTLNEISQSLKQHSKDTVGQTAKAFVLTGVVVLTFPLAMLMFSWKIASLAQLEFARNLSLGIISIASLIVTIEAFAQICRPHGLAEAHFGWPSKALRKFRRTLYVFLVIMIPLVFLVAFCEQGGDAYQAMGRLALIAALLAMTGLSQYLLRPTGILFTEVGQHAEAGWFYRLRNVWYLLAVVVPLLLVLLSVYGYQHTALHLARRMVITFWLALGIVLANAFLRRWILVAFRRFALSRATARSAEKKRHAKKDTSPSPQPDEDQELEVDITSVRNQTSQILRYVTMVVLLVGMWLIWIDSLPALKLIGNFTLWTTMGTVSNSVTSADGSTAIQTYEVEVPITIAHVAMAILLSILTIIGGKNIPYLFKMMILQKLPLKKDILFAITTVMRYIILIVGFVFVFGLIGIRWGSVQWLVAAMTVGLGFGLQEIFANFISGLIILFERPIRVGDIVTVGDTTGTVSKIRTRATSITDWDRKELIVPNKEFVTNRLVNWTLSDQVLRVVIPVGVSYGSNTQLTEKILTEIVHKNSLILKDPPPAILFSSFGDNSLNFEVRFYINGIANLMKVKHAVNMEIYQRFHDAKIAIAFPQRDTHLDTRKPLDIRIVSMQDPAEPRKDATPKNPQE